MKSQSLALVRPGSGWVIALALSAQACASSTTDVAGPGSQQVATPSGTLSVVVADDRVTGTLQTNTEAIRFEAVRGERVPAELRERDAPVFEVDARFVDTDGNIFLAMAGGHGFRDPSWRADFDRSDSAMPDVARRAGVIRLAVEAMQASRSLAIPADLFAPLDGLARYAGEALPSGSAVIGPALKAAATASTCKFSSYRQMLEVRRKDAFFNGSRTDHSAVIVSTYSTNGTAICGFLGMYATSNHGTIATSSLMSPLCTMTFAGRHSPYPPIYDETCSTPYGVHVCNSDTYDQIYSAVTNTAVTAKCWSVLPFAPTCPASSW